MPLLYLAENADEEREHLIEMVRNRIDKNDRMAILFPTRRHVYGYTRALQEAGMEVEVPSQGKRKKKRAGSGKKGAKKAAPELPAIDFSTARPKLMPYPSAKGLTFDTVLMPRLIPRLFGKVDAGRLDRWLFVGIICATQWVYFSTINNNQFMYLERSQDLEARQQITIKLSDDLLTAGASPAPHGRAESGAEGESDLSDLF